MQAANEKDPHGRALIEKNDLGEELGQYLKARKRNWEERLSNYSKTLCASVIYMLRCGRFYQCYFCIPALRYFAITRYLNDPNK